MIGRLVIAACSVAVVLASAEFFRRRQRWPFGRSWEMWLFPLGQVGLLLVLFWYELAFDLSTALVVGTALTAVPCCVANWFLFKALRDAEDKELAEMRVRLIEEQMTVQAAHLERLGAEAAEAADVRARIVSDLKQARDLLAAGQDDEAMALLQRSVDTAGAPAGHWCEHRLVDALLMVKIAACRDMGVRTTCAVDVDDDLTLPGVDVCAVFANLIDNAMHACERVAEGERFVDVRAGEQGGFLIVIVANSCVPDDGSAMRRGSGLSEHGWGLAILEGVAERYDGTFATERDDGVFRATIAMKLPPRA